MPRESASPTPWAIICSTDGQVFLTYEEYDRQINHPNSFWQCPRCGDSAGWDDDNYEKHLNAKATANKEIAMTKFTALLRGIVYKYSLSIGEAISTCIPEKRSLAMAQNDELILWMEYYLINGRRMEL